ncbi:hypothetical protein OSTOST_11690 [Ostertagia ostertagi]
MTAVASVDIATLKGKLPEGDALGVGLVVAYDKSGTGALQNTTVGLSAAYHKAFGYEKQHTISLGVQGLLVQKSIDFNALRFEDQLNPQTGNIDRPTGENFPNKDLSYPDFATGLMYSGRISEHSTAYAGVGYHHITRPILNKKIEQAKAQEPEPAKKASGKEEKGFWDSMMDNTV